MEPELSMTILVVNHGGVQGDFVHFLLEDENVIVLRVRSLALRLRNLHGIARRVGLRRWGLLACCRAGRASRLRLCRRGLHGRSGLLLARIAAGDGLGSSRILRRQPRSQQENRCDQEKMAFIP
jgi:hypothetical protein